MLICVQNCYGRFSFSVQIWSYPLLVIVWGYFVCATTLHTLFLIFWILSRIFTDEGIRVQIRKHSLSLVFTTYMPLCPFHFYVSYGEILEAQLLFHFLICPLQILLIAASDVFVTTTKYIWRIFSPKSVNPLLWFNYNI